MGLIDGVNRAEAGLLGRREVVTVHFDPAVISREKLIGAARRCGCAPESLRAGAAVKPAAKDTHYYLRRSLLRFVPMTRLQATRCNGALGTRKDPEEYLSPRQLELFRVIRAHPKAGWKSALDAEVLAAWKVASARRLARNW